MTGTTRQALHIVRKLVMTEVMLHKLTDDVLDIFDESFQPNY